MIDFHSFTENTPIPAVHREDLKRVWLFVSAREAPSNKAAGYAPSVIAQQCLSESPDTIALTLRSGLMTFMQDHGFLEEWQDGEVPRDHVFEVGATFPIPHGAAAFDLEAFLTELNTRPNTRSTP